jgi:signal transduction histidine kinase
VLSIRLIITIIISAAILVLGTITLLNNYQKRINLIFFGLCLVVPFYVIANYLADASAGSALVWTRMTFVLPTLIMVPVVYFIDSFNVRTVNRRLVAVITGFGLIVAVLSATPLVVQDITRSNGISSVVPGSLYYAYLAFALLAIGTIVTQMFLAIRRSKNIERLRIAYVVGGLATTIVAILCTNLIIPTITGSDKLSAFGTFTIIIFIVASMIAVVRHRLFDIRLVVARSVAYVLLLATLALVYGLSLFAISKIFFVNTQVGVAQQLTYLILAIILAFTFQPLRHFFERITDRIFFRNRYESHQVLAEFSNVLVRDIELNNLLKHSLQEICTGLSIGYAGLIIFNEGKVYRVAHHGELPKRLIVAPQLKLFHKPIIVADELESGELKEIFDDHGLRLSASLRTHDEVVGYLLLGDKLSGDIYSRQDIDVIGIMAKELAVAISNAKAYAEIQAFAQTLQERVNHATGRLRVANRHLKELDQAKDEFLSIASHQLRTPLTTIKGYLSMILEGDAGKISQTQKEFTENAFEGSERMVSLISDLLDVSRMSAGRFVIQPKVTDVNVMVASEVQQLQSHAEAKGLKLSLVAPAAPLPEVMLDENKTRQVVMNFIDNAIYYTDKGSVTVLLGVKAGNIHLEVRDTGMGVPPEAQKHLFSKFYRAANAQKSRPDGTGLGLFLAKRVVEDQGGSIIFSSSQGKGSIFGFDLPMVAATKEKGMAKPKISART